MTLFSFQRNFAKVKFIITSKREEVILARTIYGKITNQNGLQVQGLRVQAWDDDWPDDNDFMGDDITDANGDYSIHYEGGHWDPAPHNITIWRPDIFITVQVHNSAGGWSNLAKSGVHSNHKLAEDLRIDKQVTVYSVEKKMTTFSPPIHGFKFINSFTLQSSEFGLD